MAFQLSGAASGTPAARPITATAPIRALFTATSAAGAQQLTATIAGSPLTSAAASIAVISAPYTAKSIVFHATQGRSASATVATFTAANLSAPASSFTAAINWGDSSQSFSGTIVKDGGGAFHVTASHAYAAALSPAAGFPITVTIKQGANVVSTATGSAIVTPSSLAALTLAAFSTPVNTTLTSKVVAEFQDNNPLQTLSSTYTGTINWGATGDEFDGDDQVLQFQVRRRQLLERAGDAQVREKGDIHIDRHDHRTGGEAHGDAQDGDSRGVSGQAGKDTPCRPTFSVVEGNFLPLRKGGHWELALDGEFLFSIGSPRMVYHSYGKLLLPTIMARWSLNRCCISLKPETQSDARESRLRHLRARRGPN